MSAEVSFNEEQGLTISRPHEVHGLAGALVRMNIAKSPTSANALLSFASFILLAMTVYIVFAGPLTPAERGALPSAEVLFGRNR